MTLADSNGSIVHWWASTSPNAGVEGLVTGKSGVSQKGIVLIGTNYDSTVNRFGHTVCGVYLAALVILLATADRLRALLAEAFASEWSADEQAELLADIG